MKFNIFRILIFLTSLFSFDYSNASQKEAVLRYDPAGTDTWIPYYIGDKERPGILGELIPRILKEANIAGEIINLPAKRTQVALENGELDFDIISPSWFSNENVGEHYVLSNPIMPVSENYIYLPDTKFNKARLLTEPVGTVRGYYYHDEALFQRMDFGSERAIIQALAKGRIQYAISGDLPALYWAKRLNVNIELGTIHSDDYLVMRLRAEHQNLLKEINIAIAFLKQNEEIATIINKYTKHSNLDNAIGTY